MTLHHRVEAVVTSRADDAAFRALADIAAITEGAADVRIVGGQMVSLLVSAFPAEGTITRRTADADAAITAEIASSGDLDRDLTAFGYSSTSGNRYEKDPRVGRRPPRPLPGRQIP